MTPIGPQLVESIGPDIFQLWEDVRRQHPESDDLVAVLSHDGQERLEVSMTTRSDFVEHMKTVGRWVENSAWDVLLQPAGDRDGMPRASAIWVVIHLPNRTSEILRLVNPPLTSKGGSA